MPDISLSVTSKTSRTGRARQLEALFDLPRAARLERRWQGRVPLDDRPWNVGLIVGPSGTGKTTLARGLFGRAARRRVRWSQRALIDDFDASLSMQAVTDACQAVGLNTIPAWLRPHSTLSTGERFRADLARRIAEHADPIVVDEFTSVVDRRVARCTAHALQRYVRKHDRQFVAITCHQDIADWLRPDWVLEPDSMTFRWATEPGRPKSRRPSLEVAVSPVEYAAWRQFAPFHYLSAALHRCCRCYGLFVKERAPASSDNYTWRHVCFTAVMRKPHPIAKDIMGVSRVVTLPDWQGLGLAFVLIDTLGAAYAAIGERLRNYPAHPGFVRAHDRSRSWAMTKRPGTFDSFNRRRSPYPRLVKSRPCAVFEYAGPAMQPADAAHLLRHYHAVPEPPDAPAPRHALTLAAAA